MSKTERFEQGDIDAVFEQEREGGHPLGTRLGHRAVKQVLEVTPLVQEAFDRTIGE